MADEEHELELVEKDDGTWAVTRDGEEITTHPNRAGAEAERTRLAQQEDPQSPEPDLGGDDAARGPEDAPYPDNIGG